MNNKFKKALKASAAKRLSASNLQRSKPVKPLSPATGSTPETSALQYPGKYSPKARPAPSKSAELARLEAAAKRLAKGDYVTKDGKGFLVTDHKLKAKDLESVKELNLLNAESYHTKHAPALGAWLTAKALEDRYNVLSTTLSRLAHQGHVLARGLGTSGVLYSAPTLEHYLTTNPI